MSLFKGASTTTRSNKVEQFQATLCSFGTPLINIYGTAKVNPNVINYDSKNFETKEKRTTVKSGKSKSTAITYLYYVYVELALGTGAFLENGVIKDVTKVWVGDKSYNSLSAFNSNPSTQGAPLALNKGNNSNPTQYMQTHYPTTAVGYDKTAYCYGKIFLGEDNASMPSYSFQVRGGLVDDAYLGDSIDANPAYIIKDILTQIGLGGSIDTASFNNYANYCKQADMLVSTPSDAFTSQKKASDVVTELLELTNTYMFWSVDRFKFVPRDDQRYGAWNPNTTIIYDLDEDDFIEQSGGSPVIFKRKTSEEIYNYITVNFTNRVRDYEEESISFQDLDSINKYGVRSVTYDAKWYHTKARALKYAKMKARIAQNETNQYQFQLDWKYSRLECGDLLRISCDSINLSNQVVMVSEITESKDGIITVTALKRSDGRYSEAPYSIDDNYIYQDFNVEPSNTRVMFLTPPSDLVTSANGLEIWIGLQGETSSWGGCDVFVSDKDGEYSQAGTQGVSSIFGKIGTAMTASSTTVDVTFSNPETVELLAGSEFDAQNGNTLIWVNGECMSYTSATLLSGKNKYRLSGLIRGQYGTKAVAHSVNDAVAVLDGGMYVLPLTKHYQGKTLYFKFPSFNVFKANNQSINDLDYFTCVANVADLPNCENVRAYNKYREMADDVTRYDIVVEWDAPDFDSYKGGQVWYKTSGSQADVLGVISQGVKATELGFSKQWVFAGYGYNTVTIPQAIIGDTYRIAVCTEDIYNNVELPDMSPQIDLFVAMKTETPNTPEGLSIQYGQEITVSWKEVRNADIKTYELRTSNSMSDGKPNGELLISTTSTTCNPALAVRSGDLYLYAVSAYGKYSAPAHITYNKPKPSAPSQPKLLPRIQGLTISIDDIPNDCYGAKLIINDVSVIINTDLYFYSCNAGVYSVKYCFMDYFGEGEFSTTNVETVQAYIPSELIESESISIEKLSKSAQEAIENGGVENVNIAVKGLLGEGSALVLQTDGSYALVASNGEKLTGLFANQDGVMRLQGEYIHLTGDTVMDRDCIIKGQMVAGSISCDDGVAINAGKLTINADGMMFKNSANEVFAVTGRQMIGTASHGKHVTFNSEWDNIPSVICIPRQWQTQLSTYSNTNLYTECYASNVTSRGFDVVCRTFAQAGSYSSISYGAGSTITETPRSSTSYSFNSNTFTLSGNGAMTANITGNVMAEGFYYAGDNVFTPAYARITKITAELFIGGTSAGSKTVWNNSSGTAGVVTSGVTFSDVSYTDSKSAYIRYTVSYSVDRGLFATVGVTHQAQGGSATYRLTSAQQVATGDVTFIVTEGGSAYYSVS